MSSLASLVSADGPLHLGVAAGPDVRTLQIALSQAGYRVDIHNDGEFTTDTDYWLRQFQKQHIFTVNGILDASEAEVLDLPHADIIQAAVPLVAPSGWPYDDTASLIAFYGDPRGDLDAWKAAHVVPVACPWMLFYEGVPWHHPIQIHTKCASALSTALNGIWQAANQDAASPVLRHVRNFSGSGELRNVRGSSRISTHGFWAAMDFDAGVLPLGKFVPSSEMPQAVVDLFKGVGAYWGGDYHSRKDPMHFQFAHE